MARGRSDGKTDTSRDPDAFNAKTVVAGWRGGGVAGWRGGGVAG